MTIEAPRRVTDLRRAVTVLARERGITERRLVSLVANVALAQMLPESAVKGGTGLKLRLGESLTRETPDLDTAFRGDLDDFQCRLTVLLSDGWAGFTGTVVRGERRATRICAGRIRDATIPGQLEVRRKDLQSGRP